MTVDNDLDEVKLESNKLENKKDKKGDVYLSFYQAHYFKGKIKAHVTKNDFDDENLDFVKAEPYDEDYIRVMYGSLDFNAYTYLRIYK